jgi:hypothetical protein
MYSESFRYCRLTFLCDDEGMRKALAVVALVGVGTSAGAEPAKPAAPRKPMPILADFEIRTRPGGATSGYLTQQVQRSGPAVSVRLPGSAWDCISTPINATATEEFARLTCYYGDAITAVQASCGASSTDASVVTLLTGSQKDTPYSVAIACRGRLVGLPDNLNPQP